MSMKLNKEELEILNSIKNEDWRSISHLEESKEEYASIASYTLKKEKRINIRLSSRDLNELKRKAVNEGIPYQTYVSSILHKFINGRLIEKTS